MLKVNILNCLLLWETLSKTTDTYLHTLRMLDVVFYVYICGGHNITLFCINFRWTFKKGLFSVIPDICDCKATPTEIITKSMLNIFDAF